MIKVTSNYIPKFFVALNKDNEDIIVVSSSVLTPERDVFTVDKRLISPSVIPTNQSLKDLQPEVSEVYPFKIVTPVDEYDGSTIIITPGVNTFPSASQGYYTPIYFERYKKEVVNNLDKRFTELSATLPTEDSPGE